MERSRKIVAFAGKARSGKGELAKAMAEKYANVVILSFASYLKSMVCEILNISREKLDTLKNSNEEFTFIPTDYAVDIIRCHTAIDSQSIRKEMQNMQTTVTVRYLLQFIGTDIIRKYNTDWHVNCLINEISEYPTDKLIVIDDMRFANEKEAIDKLGGTSYYILRTDNDNNVPSHASETSLSWADFDNDKILINNSTLDNFKKWFIEIYEDNMSSTNKLHLLDNLVDGVAELSTKENNDSTIGYCHAELNFGDNINKTTELIESVRSMLEYEIFCPTAHEYKRHYFQGITYEEAIIFSALFNAIGNNRVIYFDKSYTAHYYDENGLGNCRINSLYLDPYMDVQLTIVNSKNESKVLKYRILPQKKCAQILSIIYFYLPVLLDLIKSENVTFTSQASTYQFTKSK